MDDGFGERTGLKKCPSIHGKTRVQGLGKNM